MKDNKNNIDWDEIDKAFDKALEDGIEFDEFVKEERKKSFDLNNLSRDIQREAEEKSFKTLEISLKEGNENNG